MKSFLEWWGALDWKVRLVIPAILLVISTVILLMGRIWIWGWVLGIIMLIFGGPSKSEKNGYRF